MTAGRRQDLVLLGVACLALLAAGTLAARCRAQRTERLRASPTLDQAPPAVLFTTVALGGFRGLLADVLWLRVAHLQDQGRYTEIVQLSDWISRLEPENAEVWEYHAWNMAYNVSALMAGEEDRWRWVRYGLRLLRDEALRYNPGEPRLHAQLSWLFQHKMGAFSDEANVYYKRRWADEMEGYFPGGRPPWETPVLLERIQNDLRMAPDTLRVFELAIGKLDWRLPESHAAYWAFAGLQAPEDAGSMTCRRLLYQTLATLFFRGTRIPDPDAAVDLRLTRTDLADAALTAFGHAVAASHDPAADFAISNFVHDAILVFDARGDTARANDLLALLRKRHPDAAQSVEAFARSEPEFASLHAHGVEPLAIVEGLLWRHFTAIANDDVQTATNTLATARHMWTAMESRYPLPVRRRHGMPSFDRFRTAVLGQVTPSLSPEKSERLRRKAGDSG
jgi:hypothetical protein